MAETTEKAEELAVIEGQDGSATINLPENMLDDNDDQQNDAVQAENAEGGQVQDDQNDDVDHPSDNAELREARRNRRKAKKELIRKTNQEKDIRLQQLARENDEFRRRLSQLERNTKAEHVTRIDKNIEDAQVRLEYAKMKLAEATQNQDGQAMVEAQTLWQTANEEIRSLSNLKQRASDELRQPQQQELPNPTIQKLATKWMNRNSWYNPAGNDRDSIVAKKIDELMTAQGLDPSDPDYWDELDARLQKEIPHRYNEGNDDDSRDVRRPRNVVGSSGREAAGSYGGVSRNQFVLSPERVRAMKEAGAWDNPERKAKMIKQFMAYDRANGNRN